MANDRVSWWECHGSIVCGPCRKADLKEWSPKAVREKGGTKDEMVRPEDFIPLGRTPWAGNPPGLRYMQCDGCNGQWGPDA